MANGKINVRIKVSPNLASLAEVIDGMRAEMVDWTPLWPRVIDSLIAGVRRIIASRGADLTKVSYGHVWRSTDSRYLRRKMRQGHGAVDLKFSGSLTSRITSRAGVLQQTPKRLVFGVRGMPYAQYLNFVKRPFLGMSETMEVAVTSDMNAFMDLVAHGAMARVGGA